MTLVSVVTRRSCFGEKQLEIHSSNSSACSSGQQQQQQQQPATGASLATRMRDLRQDVQKKISRLRSRSAERVSHKSMVMSESSAAKSGSGRVDTTPVLGGHILPTPPSTHVDLAAAYKGPFMGRAVALVDYTPSPYDRDALRFKRGDVIDVISMNPSGLWKGKCQGRIGNFKFINVELMPARGSSGSSGGHRSRSNSKTGISGKKTLERSIFSDTSHLNRSRRRTSRMTMIRRSSPGRSGMPTTVEELLKVHGLEEYLSVFVLNGFEDMDSFLETDEAELDYLGITDEHHRAKLLSLVQQLRDHQDFASEDEDSPQEGGDVATSGDVDIVAMGKSTRATFRRLSFPRDSGCFFGSQENVAPNMSNNNSVTNEDEIDAKTPATTRMSPATSDRSSNSAVSSGIDNDISQAKRAGIVDTRKQRVNTDEEEDDDRDWSFEALVEKYGISNSSRRQLNSNRQFRSPFLAARNVFEQQKGSNDNVKKFKEPLVASSVD